VGSILAQEPGAPARRHPSPHLWRPSQCLPRAYQQISKLLTSPELIPHRYCTLDTKRYFNTCKWPLNIVSIRVALIKFVPNFSDTEKQNSLLCLNQSLLWCANISPLEAVKARLDVALGSLVCWLVTLHVAGGWNWMSIVVLCNPGHSMVLWFYDPTAIADFMAYLFLYWLNLHVSLTYVQSWSESEESLWWFIPVVSNFYSYY